MTHTTSRVPAAIDALIAAVTPVLGASVNVVDGPPLSWDVLAIAGQAAVSEDRFLFIGAQPDNPSGADAVQDFNAAGAVSHDERFTIYCTAFAWSGDTGIKTVRDAAFAIPAAVDQVIRTDPSLAQAVLYSRMSGVVTYAPVQHEDGAGATVVFTVAARAYLF